MQDGHFAIEQGARARSGAFSSSNGTAGVWRRSALRRGRVGADTLTEDTDLSIVPNSALAVSLSCRSSSAPRRAARRDDRPLKRNSALEQRADPEAKKLLPRILPRRPVRARPKHFSIHRRHQLAADARFVMLLLPTSIVRASHRQFQSIWIDYARYFIRPSRLWRSTWSRSARYLQRLDSVHCCTWPLLIALASAFRCQNTKAVFEGLFGIRSDFVRYAKYNLTTSPRCGVAGNLENSSGWFPVLEIAFGLYYVLLLA